MKTIKYLLKGFGFENLNDFSSTTFKIFYTPNAVNLVSLSGILGTARLFIENSLGMDIIVFAAFVFLIIAEMQTGIKAAIQKKGERIKSRKIGRMILKIGIYSFILFILYSFSSKMKNPTVLGFEVNPFEWLYYVVFTSIVFQLVISWLENLSILGYHEAKGLVGVILRKYNKWFEFDGTKDADKSDKNE